MEECPSPQYTYISHEFVPKKMHKGKLYCNMRIPQLLIMACSHILPSEVKLVIDTTHITTIGCHVTKFSISSIKLAFLNMHHLEKHLKCIGKQKDNS